MGNPEEAGYGSAAVPDKSSRNPFRRFRETVSGSNTAQGIGTDEYRPPPGPPPSSKQRWEYEKAPESSFHPPSGPPPSQKQRENEKAAGSSFQPPPCPPPSYGRHEDNTDETAPPPYDPWLTVPDNSSLPPPPGLSYENSPTSNAPEDMANMARSFTYNNPLHYPRQLRDGELAEIRSGHVALTKPPGLERVALTSSRPGTWHVRTPRGTPDSILLSSLPVFAAMHHDPRRTGTPHNAYFEVKCIRFDATPDSGDETDAIIAIGFIAPPYPPFRMPGWERASLGVHSDDGRRFVNDNRGGRDFTTTFSEGEVVGIGMTFSPPYRQGDANRIEIFFTRDGQRAGSWNLWEDREIREEDLGNPEGLGGDRDLIAAVGVLGAVEFEWRGRRDEWLYRPDLNR